MIIKNWTTDAIVVRRSNVGEYDRIHVLYTKELGKISAIAKGVRKPKSRIASHLEPGNIVRIELAEGKNLHIITGAKITQYLSFESLDTMQSLFIWLELIDKITHPDEPNTLLFDTVTDALQRMSSASSPRDLVPLLELGLYSQLGYELVVDRCVVGAEPLQETKNFFSPGLGGVVCGAHLGDIRDALTITPDAIKLLRLIEQQQYDIVQRITIEPIVSDELKKIAKIERHRIIDQDLKSEHF